MPDVMQIRSITVGMDASWPLPDSAVTDAGRFLARARAAFERAGFVVQTTRLCTQPAHLFVAPEALPELVRTLDAACSAAAIPYCAVGGISLGDAWTEEAAVAAVVDSVCASERIFSSLQVAKDGAIDFRAARAAGAIIKRISARTPDGFGNLRFAAAAGCPANIPFFPAAWHAGGKPRFALALQAANAVVETFSGPGSVDDAEARLLSSLEESGTRLEQVAADLEKESGVIFAGLDLSPAPFPVDFVSAVGGLEALGQRFGGAGSIFMAWRLTQTLKRTRLRRAGFSGLMMPVLEDTVLARRAAEGLLSVNDLLLYSTICGTGLDTVPLPGDISEAELAGIVLDVAALSTALQKPLTARLFPIPGKRAGDPAEFDFPFFVPSRVLATKGLGAEALLARALDER
jgi:uncharacterized protein (UPF0210 family)